MKRYWVHYEIMQGNIDMIAIKETYVYIESGDPMALINQEVSKLAAGAKVVDYNEEDDDYIGAYDAFC